MEGIYVTYVDLPQSDKQATIHVLHGEVVGVGIGFTPLTGYDDSDVLSRQISEVLMSALKLSPASYDTLTATGSAEGYIFTASGKALDVTVSVKPSEKGGVRYYLEEKLNMGVDEHISILEPLFQDEFISVALYSIPELIVLKSNRNYTEFTRQICRLTGEILGRSVREHASTCRTLLEMLDTVIENGKVSHFSEMLLIGTDGQEIYRTYTFQPVFVSGRMKYIIETSRDSTESVNARILQERYLAEIKLQKEKLEAIIENLADPLIIIDKEGRYEKLNKAARDVFGRGAALIKVGDIISSGVYSDFCDNIILYEDSPGRRLADGEMFRHYELKTQSTDTPRYFDVSGTPVHEESGEFVCGVLYCRDITEQFSHKKQMSDKNMLLSAVIENMHDALVIFDGEGKISFINAKARDMYPSFTEKTTVLNVHDAINCFSLSGHEIPKEDLPARRVMKGETIRNECIVIMHRDWKKVTEINATPIFDDSGKLASAVVSHHDVTERKKMEDALRESEMNYRMGSEGYGAGVYAYDFFRRKGYLSSQYRMILGMAPDAVLTADPDFAFTGVHPEDKDRLITALNATYDPAGGGIHDITYRIIRMDGAIRWVQAKGQTFFAGQGDKTVPYLAAGAIVDITDEKTIGDQIRRISEELTHIIESTDDFIWSVDRDHHIIFSNTAARNHFRELFGRDINDIDKMTDILPRIALPFKEQMHQVCQGRVRVELRTPISGRVVSYTLNPVFIDGEFGEVTVFGKDITERLNTEREIIRLNSSLEECVAERTEQLQQTVRDLKNIALILSHDLKSALRGIGLYAGEILGEIDIRDNAQKIRMIHRELLTMVDGLMNYEKSSWLTIEKQTVNIKKIVISVFNELNAGSPVKGILEFETGLPAVMADSDSLRHAIMNIMSNALKFAMPGRALRVDVGCRAEDNFYIIYFRDNGIGFDAAYSEKIFGVFERLNSKSEYEGSGVGLAIVRNIIQRHGGRVWAESEPGIGTTMFISLPISISEDKV
jgi:PAS domain S-box-containing protein